MKLRLAPLHFLQLILAGIVSLALARAELPPTEPGLTVEIWAHGADHPAHYNYRGAIAQTPDGYLWLGSPLGLVRFDGSRFVTLTTNDTPALGDNRISSLLVDQRGVLWIATMGGTLSRREAGTILPVPVDPRLHGHPIESLACAENGGLWLATAKWGLIQVRPGEEQFSRFTGELSSRTARSLVKLENDEFWGRTVFDLVKLDGEGVRGESIRLPPESPICFALAASRSGNTLWLATSAATLNRGARIFEVENGQMIRELAPYPWDQNSAYSSVNCIAEDPRGRVWVSTALNGVYFWQPGRGWRELLLADRRSLIRITRFHFDEDGRLWMNDLDGRLYRVTEQAVATVPLEVDRPKVMITAACITRDATLWVGTEAGGIHRFQEESFAPADIDGPSSPVITLFEDSRGTILAGTWNGLFRWDGSRFHPVAPEHITDRVMALHEDRGGTLWAGSGNRIVRIRPDGKVRSFGLESGLGPHPGPGKGMAYVVGLAEDAHGGIFVAQAKHGLLRLSGDRFEPVGDSASREADGHLLPDGDGSLWIVTSGAGLFRFRDEAFQSWDYGDGLPNPVMCAGIADEAGTLWFGSNVGIFGCSKKELLEYQRGQSPPIPFRRLGEAHGLNGPRISGNSQSMVARSADGRLWFPNGNALAVFDPDQFARLGAPRAPIIEEVLADEKIQTTEAGDDSLRLPSGLRRLQIHFTCPNSKAPAMLRFRYRLEGLDDEWVEAGTERVAHYRQVEPGAYTFRVQVSGDSTEWKESLTPLELTIVPRWWERPTVRLFIFLSLAGLLAGAGWRGASARHRKKLLQLEVKQARDQLTHLQRASSVGQMAATLAHEINQPLAAILRNAEAGELFLQQNPPDIGELQSILVDIREDAQRAGEVIERMRSLLKHRAPNLELLSLEDLLNQLASLTKPELQARQINLQLKVPGDLPPVRGDWVQLQQVLLNLAINAFNAMGDTPPERRKLVVRARLIDPQTVELAISDNGHGIPGERLDRVLQPFFSTKEEGLGMGLAISQTIVAAHGGTIRAENNPDGGATFRFTLRSDNLGAVT